MSAKFVVLSMILAVCSAKPGVWIQRTANQVPTYWRIVSAAPSSAAAAAYSPGVTYIRNVPSGVPVQVTAPSGHNLAYSSVSNAPANVVVPVESPVPVTRVSVPTVAFPRYSVPVVYSYTPFYQQQVAYSAGSSSAVSHSLGYGSSAVAQTGNGVAVAHNLGALGHEASVASAVNGLGYSVPSAPVFHSLGHGSSSVAQSGNSVAVAHNSGALGHEGSVVSAANGLGYSVSSAQSGGLAGNSYSSSSAQNGDGVAVSAARGGDAFGEYNAAVSKVASVGDVKSSSSQVVQQSGGAVQRSASSTISGPGVQAAESRVDNAAAPALYYY